MPTVLDMMKAEALRSALEKENLCVWPVNLDSVAFKLGLIFGVTLSWPGEATEGEIEVVKSETERFALENGFNPNLNGPTFAAGGVLVMYCGIETPLLIAATKKALEVGKPIWQVCQEGLVSLD